MIKLLIVDSDMESVRHFQGNVRTFFPDIRDVSVLSDAGKDVLEAVRRVRPDLILMDVRFPGTALFNVMRDIHTLYPSLRFIIYGNYNDSDYMRGSLAYGVLDYLYRPVKQIDFHRVMTEAESYFKRAEDERRSEEDVLGRYWGEIGTYERVFLLSLLSGDMEDEGEAAAGLRFFNIDDLKPDKGFTVMSVRADHFRRLAQREKYTLIYKALLSAREKLPGHACRAFVRAFDSMAVILSGYYTAKQAADIAEDLRLGVAKDARTSFSVGVGRWYQSLSDIAVSYKEAERALKYRFIMGHNSVIHIDYAEPGGSAAAYRYPAEKEAELAYAAAIGEYNECKAILNDMSGALKNSGPLPDGLLPKLILSVVFSINRCAALQNFIKEPQMADYFNTGEIMKLGDTDRAFAYLDGALRRFCDFALADRDRRAPELVNRAKEYLRRFYAKPFYISKVAPELGATPEYLTRAFEKHAGMRPMDFLVNIRVGEARRLLRETNLDDEAIAGSVGYNDVRHFRSIFRQHDGRSTQEYRQEARG